MAAGQRTPQVRFAGVSSKNGRDLDCEYGGSPASEGSGHSSPLLHRNHSLISRSTTATNFLAMCNDEMFYEDAVDQPVVQKDPSVVLQGGLKRMTPCQEYANAASMVCMLIPCVIFLACRPDAHVNVWIVSIAQFVHMPASMLYHIQMGRYHKEVHPIDNPWRVADQFFIMVGAAGWAFALSGALWYGACVSLLVLVYCYWLCVDYREVAAGRPTDPLRGGPPGRRYSIAILVVLQIGPIVAHRQWFWGGLAALAFAASATVFITYPFGGYSHTVFHFGLGPFQWCILEAADGVAGIRAFKPDGGNSLDEQRAQWMLGVLLVLCIVVRHFVCCRPAQAQEEDS